MKSVIWMIRWAIIATLLLAGWYFWFRPYLQPGNLGVALKLFLALVLVALATRVFTRPKTT